MDWEKLIKAAEVLSEQEMAVIYRKVIHGFPNTYSFTKHMAESLIADAAAEIPVVIIRPPVVYVAYREPKPGWTRGDTGMFSLNFGVGMGVLRVLLVDPTCSLALVPIDTVVNGTLVASWQNRIEPTNSYQPKPVLIYQINYKNYEWDSWRKVMCEGDSAVPQSGKAWHSILPYLAPNFFLFYVMHIFFHLIPGAIIDAALKLSGRKPRLLTTYRIFYAGMDVLHYFSVNSYEFDINNIKNLQNSIPDIDKDTFPFDMPVTRSEWLDYGLNCSRGAREFSGHPRIPTEQDIRQNKRLYYVHCAFLAIFYASLLWIFPYTALCNFMMNTLSI